MHKGNKEGIDGEKNLENINKILQQIKQGEKDTNVIGEEVIVKNIIYDVINLFLDMIPDENGIISNKEYEKIKKKDCDGKENCTEIYYEK